MKPLEMALEFMERFYSGNNPDSLRELLANNFTFSGPLYQFDSAEDFILSLKTDPPKYFEYKIVQSFEQGSSAGLFYNFSKPGLSVPMAQLFETSDGKIKNIILIFDARVFS